MKILLTAINAKYIHSNLAVYSLKNYVEGFKQNVDIVEYTINQNLDDILADLFIKHPDLLCFSCYLWNISYVKQLIVEVKKVLPEVMIWLGGPEVSYSAAKVLQEYPQVEGIICGEGEQTFLEVVEYYRGKRASLKDINGIVYRVGKTFENEGQIVENPFRPVMDLSSVPFVYNNMDRFAHKIIYYESSRGCPFSCSYCLSSVDKRLRFRNLDLVKEELQALIDAQVPQVKFVDRTFNCKHEHALEIWKYLSEHDQGKTNFHFEVAADLLNEEELSLIENMRPGLIQLEIGVQSTNPKTIKEIHRTMKFDVVKRNVERIHKKGNIHQHLDLIAGLPYEDYESFRHSFNDVYALKPEQLQLGFLKVLKGSYMYENAQRYELVYQERPPFEVLSTKWLSYEDIIRLKGIEEMVEVYYNSRQFEHTIEKLEHAFEDAFTMFEALSDYYKTKGFFSLNHSRIARYEILLQFIEEQDSKHLEDYRQLLTFDLYLRDNVKNRPEFSGEETVLKEEAAAFYDSEAEKYQYLEGYESYDKRQIRKMTHLEKIDGKLYLFDYKNRSPLTNQARVIPVS